MPIPIIETAFGIALTVFVSAFSTYVIAKLKGYRRVSVAMEMAMRALLRDKLIQSYNKYVDGLGYCPIYAKDGAREVYVQYKALGGNGTADGLYEDIMALPTTQTTAQQREGTD